jgi:hypothetical protein
MAVRLQAQMALMALLTKPSSRREYNLFPFYSLPTSTSNIGCASNPHTQSVGAEFPVKEVQTKPLSPPNVVVDFSASNAFSSPGAKSDGHQSSISLLSVQCFAKAMPFSPTQRAEKRRANFGDDVRSEFKPPRRLGRGTALSPKAEKRSQLLLAWRQSWLETSFRRHAALTPQSRFRECGVDLFNLCSMLITSGF